AVAELDRLDAGRAREIESVRDADTHLVAGAVRRLVSEEDEVVASTGGAFGLDRFDDRRRGRYRIPLAAIALQQDRALDAQRHGIAQLVGRGLRPQRQHGRTATVRFDHAHGFLDRAFLVGTDRESEIARVDVLGVGRQRDLAGGGGDALDANQDVHRPGLAPHAGVLRIEERRGADNGDGCRVLLAKIFDRELGAGLRLFRWKEAHQDGLADRWA